MTGRGNPEPDRPQVVQRCDELVLEVILVDVDMNVAVNVKTGDVLRVQLVEDRYPAAFIGDERVGSIASGGALSRLVECLKAGQAYTAIVLELEPPLVRVRIGPA